MSKRYGLGTIVFDIFMIIITGGLWLIWLFIKHVRTH